jgi:hypothetical protein
MSSTFKARSTKLVKKVNPVNINDWRHDLSSNLIYALGEFGRILEREMSIGLDPLPTMQELRENPDYVDLTDTNLMKIRLKLITSRLKKSEVLSDAKLKMCIQRLA